MMLLCLPLFTSILLASSSLAQSPTGPPAGISHDMRFEIKSNMLETGHVFSSDRRRFFAVSFYLPPDALLGDESQKKFPLVFWSSGTGGQVSVNYNTFLREVADAGYIVAAVEHTYLDFAVLLDGENVTYAEGPLLAFFAFPHINSPKEMLVRARDVSCLLDLLTDNDDGLCSLGQGQTEIEPNSGALQSDFASIAAMTEGQRIGYIGHSAGGNVAQSIISVSSHPQGETFPELCNPIFDDRISAAISYDGGAFLDWTRSGRLTKPFLFVASDYWWVDNYNLTYRRVGATVRANVEVCLDEVGDSENAEACAQDPGIMGFNDNTARSTFRNKRKVVESRVACRRDGYAIRLFGSDHNSFNFDSYKGTVPYEESLKNTLLFLDKYLYRGGEMESIISEVEPSIGKVYSNEVVDPACDTDDGPDKDKDTDGLSNSDELLLFLTDPRLKDSDFDQVCDGKETMNFENPAVFDIYVFPDKECFDINDNETRENVCYDVMVEVPTKAPTESSITPELTIAPVPTSTTVPTSVPTVQPTATPTVAPSTQSTKPTSSPANDSSAIRTDSPMQNPEITTSPNSETALMAPSSRPTLASENRFGSAARCPLGVHRILHVGVMGWLWLLF